MIALTLALYVTVYLGLIVAYVGVVKYMAEKPVDMPGAPVREGGQAVTA
jgi:cytochrome d ubiquinol oxidase subunit I